MLASAGLASDRSFSSFPRLPVSTISRMALLMASPMPSNRVRSASSRTSSSMLSDRFRIEAAALRYAFTLYGFSFWVESSCARLASRSAISALLRAGQGRTKPSEGLPYFHALLLPGKRPLNQRDGMVWPLGRAPGAASLFFTRFSTSFIVNWLPDFRPFSSFQSSGRATGAPGRARTA